MKETRVYILLRGLAAREAPVTHFRRTTPNYWLHVALETLYRDCNLVLILRGSVRFGEAIRWACVICEAKQSRFQVSSLERQDAMM